MNTINTELFLKMLEKGSKKIEQNFEYINDLNVFPVPDGDTGTNMMLTIKSSYEHLISKKDVPLSDFAKSFSRTLLMNARGNSGVIFTQIFRGFFSTIVTNAEKEAIEISDIATLFANAKDAAYSSVSNPVEGTMLTIVRVISETLATSTKNYSKMIELFKDIVEVGNKTVTLTTDMLPQLKEANLVDSGAYGLMLFIEGMTEALEDENSVPNQNDLSTAVKKTIQEKKNKQNTKRITYIDNFQRQEVNEEGFGYCCEFICELNYQLYAEQKGKEKLIPEKFEKELLEIGDSLVKIIDDNLVKVHLHTFSPHKLLQIGQKYGEFLKVKVENMTQQYLDNHPEESRKEIFSKHMLSEKIKILVTVPSENLGKFFKKEFGIADYINTEHTGNPSIVHFTDKIKNLQSKNVILITDDVNVILAAEQAIKLQASKYNIVLLKGRNPGQVLSSLFVFNPDHDIWKNRKLMEKAIDHSRTGAISTSIKSLKTNGITVYKGDYIAIINKDIIHSDSDIVETVKRLIRKLSAWRRSSFVNIIYGKDATKNQISIIEKFINEQLNMKCKIIEGNQNVYHYYISV